MKKGLLIWNVILTIVTGFLLVVYFGSTKKGSSSTPGKNADKATNNGAFKIAYFEMDSVAANFDLVKEVKAELNKKEDDINNELDKLSKNLQQKFNYYQNLAQAGNLSQDQSEAASLEMKRLDDQLKNRKMQLDQDYTDLMTRRQNDIKTKIEAFLKEFNKDKTYSYIISYEQGLFYYKDSAYNITDELIEGLNEMYKSASTKKK